MFTKTKLLMSQNYDLIKVEWVDEARDGRIVPVKIYKPRGDEPCPLIMWSHGLGGTRDGAGFILREFVTRFGFMVVTIQHYGTDDVLWRGKAGHPWDNIRDAVIDNDALMNRFIDTRFVLDNLLKNNNIDHNKIGYMGHSLGALSVQVLCGQLWQGDDNALMNLADERIKYGLLHSPVPALSKSHPIEVFKGIDRPVLHMTGTEDVSPLSGYGFQERFRIFDNAVHAPRAMIVLDEADHMVFAGSRGQLAGYDRLKEHEEQIKELSCEYWSAIFETGDLERTCERLKDHLNTHDTLEYRSPQS